MDLIRIKGASQHNLKNISLDIPRDRLVVITGVSGSGKSSLAFDTIYAEGQRRYVESLSTYARQFIGQMDKPEVESIEGLSPAIAIEQRSSSHNPRSTVGTVTEIYDYLRLLFARIGVPHCYRCGREIRSQTIDMMVAFVLGLPEKTRVNLLAPIVRGKKGEFQKELKKLLKDGFVRVRVDGELRELADEIVLDKNKRHDIDCLVDRLVVKDGIRKRLRDSLETATGLTDGLVRVEVVGGGELLFSEKYACPDCGISLPELAPRMFSFNTPYGACPDCGGLGSRMYFDESLVVPDPSLSIREGAIAPWAGRNSIFFFQRLDALAQHYQFDINTPFNRLPERVREALLYGSGKEKIKFYWDRHGRRFFYTKAFEGIINKLDRRYRETSSNAVRQELMKYINLRECPACRGGRLKQESMSVTVAGRNIFEVCRLSIRDCMDFFNTLPLTPQEGRIAAPILKEIRERLRFLIDVGVDYLSLERSAGTLSGGEGQRIRLATQIGSGLMGVLYILDEPTVGLHQRDNVRLISTLKHLRDLGNTVVVVEHDRETITAADHVIDFGPGAGIHGGEVVFAGTPAQLRRCRASLTGQYLSGRREIPLPERRRPTDKGWLTVRGARLHNLQGIDAAFPLGALTFVTGVSGAGKSSLVNLTLYPALANRLNGARLREGEHAGIEGLDLVDKVIDIDQKPIGRTPRSNPATYVKVFDHIREVFAQQKEARLYGYSSSRFSFNLKGGRCETCHGAGVIKVEMHFLADVYVPCDTCHGRRFNEATLKVRFAGASITDVLEMTIEEARRVFVNFPRIRRILDTLIDVGLGYVRLGQPSPTLSGGEAQRIKLARELSRAGTGRTVYILDEPTTGLHFEDVRKLLAVLQRLVDSGNTVIVIEHNLDAIRVADYVIDMGPEGGGGGGRIVAVGTPEEVAAHPTSSTGQHLRPMLGDRR